MKTHDKIPVREGKLLKLGELRKAVKVKYKLELTNNPFLSQPGVPSEAHNHDNSITVPPLQFPREYPSSFLRTSQL